MVDEMPDYRNPQLSVDRRIADLLGRMTLEEKVGQMMQVDARGTDVRELILQRHVGSMLHTKPQDIARAARIVREESRLGIPLLIADDCIHGYSFWPGATIFPEQLGMAATWDPQKVEQAARVTAREVSATGVHWTFSPVLCIARDTRWGRVGETFGEDPLLIGDMACAMVRGYQGGAGVGEPLPKDAILACAKHFAGYSETQGGRDASEADLSHRKLASWFLPPFERAAKQGCGTFMLGYESIDGVPVTFNQWLLTDVLRGAWGYGGTLVTDWDNVGRAVWEQHVKADYVQAAADAVAAGNDMVMATPKFYEGAIEAVRFGLLNECVLDQAVARIVALKFRLGLFEDPRVPDDGLIRERIGAPEHEACNLQLAHESVVLLRNEGALPLQRDRVAHVAVCGPLADDAQMQLGDWAGNSGQVDWMPQGHPRNCIVTVVDGLREVFSEARVTYEPGARVVDLMPDPAGETYPDGQPRPKIAVPAAVDRDMVARAVEQARRADVVVAVVGDVIELIGEGRSTATLELQGGQCALLEALAQVAHERQVPFVVVLMSSKPQVLPQAALQADALLWAPSPGMQGGRALAQILAGVVEPSGRLPITFPRHAGQLPVYYNQIRGQHGDRYADLTQDPAFVFGEGLSYTSFAYGGPRLQGDGVFGVDDVLELSVEVTNTGDRFGVEVAQVYVRDMVTSLSWTDKELKAYRRVELAPGERATLHWQIPVSACSMVDAQCRRVVEPGEFALMVGHSSRESDLRSVMFTVR